MTKTLTIGLVGAPGSGKQGLAREFVKLTHDFALYFPPIALVNPGHIIETHHDVAMGMAGSHRESLWAHHVRYGTELAAVETQQSFISPGTVIDNLAHAAAYQESLVAGVRREDTKVQIQEANMFMSVLTVLLLRSLSYDAIFYLPFEDTGDDLEDVYSRRVDRNIVATMFGLGLGIQRLEAKTDQERAIEVHMTIEEKIDQDNT